MLAAAFAVAAACAAWPGPGREARPWAYNWWMGSAVTEDGLRAQAAAMKEAGFGGFHVIPVYGAPGNGAAEARFLSPKWSRRFAAATRIAEEYGLGVDMSGAPGFTFGGPEISPRDSFWTLETMPEDAVPRRSGATNLWAGAGADGRRVKLVASPAARRLKRAASIDPGLMIDPLSPASMAKHLAALDAAFAAGTPKPRALYHDSYDYHGAAWSPGFADEFARRRGYRLESHFAKLAGAGAPAETARVKEDYRRTASELMAATFGLWTEWCRARGILTRYEAHGSPADWLALYSLADIPETEVCGYWRGKTPIAKFASSAAHTAGRRLVACETGTWLGNHFHVRLCDLKRLCDTLFLAGVNHVFYHGTCYSPPEEKWPGRIFYAATQVNPRNPVWRDLPALNEYVARCQAILQTCRVDNDLLVYWPLRDWWRTAPGLLGEGELSVGGRGWFHGTPFGDAAEWLWNNGYAFDYVSDATLPAAVATGRYKAVYIPEGASPPPETAALLERFRRAGGCVAGGDVRKADIRARRFGWTRKDGLACLPLVREKDGARMLFAVNQGGRFAGRVDARFSARAAAAMDPWDGSRRALACAGGAVEIELEPGESVFLLDGAAGEIEPPPPRPSREAPILGPWRMTPVCGGPAMEPRTVDAPAAWSANADGSVNPFCGTVRYEAAFAASAPSAVEVDAGEVRESARLFVNGREIGVRIMPPFRWRVPADAVRRGRNAIAVEVTNLGANRVRDMFLRGDAGAFADLGVLAQNYKPLDASAWPVEPCGLAGPVRVLEQ